MYFQFRQNNSGGYFDKDMGYSVWIEADNAKEANCIAKGVGIYFNGCDDGSDCACCGDRWDSAWEDDGEDKPSMNEYAPKWGLDEKIVPKNEAMRTLTKADCV
jgi:hypothetical protein